MHPETPADPPHNPGPPPIPGPPPMPTPPRLGDGTTPDLTTVHFACVNCGGQLVFHPPTRGMKCPSCGSERPIEAAEEKPAERDLLATLEDQRKPPSAQAVTSGPQKELVCPNCNGHIGFVGSLTATRCPFCASPVQRSDIHEAPNRLPVDGVVPFGIDTMAAEEKVKEWINGRWFAPNDFKKYSKTGSFSGVYLPFFTFDAQTYTEYEGQRGDNYTVTVGSGQNQRTETRIRWRHVSGAVDVPFDDVAIGAEHSLDPERLQALEPWPTQAAVAFRPEYLAGSMSRFYEKELDVCHSEAVQRMNNDIAYAIRRDIGGDHQRIHRTDTTWSRQTYRHLLLPIFLLVVMFHAKPYQVFVNGVTGEVQGERPYSWIKITLAVIAALIVVGVGLGVYYSGK